MSSWTNTRVPARRHGAMIATAVALAFTPLCTIAAEQEPRGFYVGAMAGVTTFDDDGMFNGLKLDDSGVGYAVFGGYKFLRYLAVEARISGLGGYSVKDPNLGQSEDFDASAISAHVVGIVPFGKSGWELFGQLGLGSAQIDTDCCGDDSQTVGSAGLGVRYYPTPHLGISLQTDAYAYEEDAGFGTYDVGVVATQLGFQYLF